MPRRAHAILGGVIEIPPIVKAKAIAANAESLLTELPALVSELESEWQVTVWSTAHRWHGGVPGTGRDC